MGAIGRGRELWLLRSKEVNFTMAVHAEVDETERLREELRETRQMLDDAQRLTRTGSWVIDPIGGGASCSSEGYRILGLPGKTFSAHYMECLANVHPDDLPEVLRNFGESVQTGEPRPIHYRIVGPDGATTDVETIAQPVSDDTGHVVRVVGTVMDVTERNRLLQLARGQVSALTRTLDALVQEASTDRLVEPVLRAIVEQFGADTIAVWLSDGRDPQPPAWPEVVRTKQPHVGAEGLVIPMLIAGDAVGMITIQFVEPRSFRPAEVDLAQALANQAMLAIQLTRLSDESRRAAVIAERNRMARDVHDTLAQGFTGVIIQLEAAEQAFERGLMKDAAEHQVRAAALARAGLQEARRSVLALRPQALENQNLPAALQELVTRMTDGTSLAARFALDGTPYPLPEMWDEHLLRIGQEALTNVLRHSGAHQLVMRLAFDSDHVRLSLQDDGRGFDPTRATDGAGLAGIRSRVSSMGGRLAIDTASDIGTTVAVTLPSP